MAQERGGTALEISPKIPYLMWRPVADLRRSGFTASHGAPSASPIFDETVES